MPVRSALAPPAPLPGTELWRRTVRLLARLRRRHFPPVRLSRPAQIRSLVEVLDKAVSAQRPADAAVAACGEPGPVTGRTAQACGRAGTDFQLKHGSRPCEDHTDEAHTDEARRTTWSS
ncbi:hypothetical protein [Streptomyces sp. NPDC001450]